ncbi:DHHC palmitoyltransferase [Musa troglodytarum]|uniref:DHHC palmitoyltransferase n=1 Tax=Musa troglodytarum TaxID=320322 RepID=A0A9E7EYP5_9LILI|nr:DHHC palmitoyltransferase [Musa troglodytarum]
MAGNAGDRSLMNTPTWAVAIVCAVFHVLYSVLTMALALAKRSSCSADPLRFRFTHQTSFVKQHVGLPSTIGIRWISVHCGSLPSSVYFLTSMGIVYTLASVSFVPLMVLLVFGLKLELVIMEMAQEIQKRTTRIRGAPVVEPSNKYFWFNRLRWILFLIHLTLSKSDKTLRLCFHFRGHRRHDGHVREPSPEPAGGATPHLDEGLVPHVGRRKRGGTHLDRAVCRRAREPAVAQGDFRASGSALVSASASWSRGGDAVASEAMARRHGWQLPAHTFQVIAITVFFLLSIAFYAFFAPFIGRDLYEYVAIGVYSFLALCVFILYVRCTAIDPADPGILLAYNEASAHMPQRDRGSLEESTKIGFNTEEETVKHKTASFSIGCFFCALLSKEDCRKDEDNAEQQTSNDEALFCTLCNAELAVESGIGIAVLVRSFTDKKQIESQIVERLGDGFSHAPFVTIVGITTYEYVVAMRAQTEPPGPSVNEDQQSLPSSPMSSAPTAISGSSLGLQYRGAWCTPPRIFVDQQDEIIPHLEPGRVPSTIDPDALDPSGQVKKPPKHPVPISAWKLAKLDKNEAKRAAAKARASSSVLKPIGSHMQYDIDRCSSGNISSRSSTVSADIGHQDHRVVAARSSPLKSSYPPSRASREDLETCPRTPSSFSSPHNPNSLSLTPALEQQPSNTRHFNPIYQSSANRSPWSVQSSDAKESMAAHLSEHGQARRTGTNPLGSSGPSVYWDQEAGRFVSSQSIGGPSSRASRTELLYTEPSIFFGGPMLNEGPPRSFRNAGTSNQRQGGTDRGRGPSQLPIFVPRDYQQDQLSRFP